MLRVSGFTRCLRHGGDAGLVPEPFISWEERLFHLSSPLSPSNLSKRSGRSSNQNPRSGHCRHQGSLNPGAAEHWHCSRHGGDGLSGGLAVVEIFSNLNVLWFPFPLSLGWATLAQTTLREDAAHIPIYQHCHPLRQWECSIQNCSQGRKSTTPSPPRTCRMGFSVCFTCSAEQGFMLFQLSWRRKQQNFLPKCGHWQSTYFSVGKRIKHGLLHLPITHKGRELLAGPICGSDQQPLVIKGGKRKTPGWNFTYFKWIKEEEWQWEERDTALDPRFGNPYEGYQS